MTDSDPSEGNSETEETTDDSEFTQDDAVRGILKGAGVVYAGLVLNMGIAFVAQRFAAVYLSIGGFGSLLSGTALLNVGSILAGFGLASGLTRYLPRVNNANKRSLVKYSLLISLPFSVVMSTVIVIFADTIATQIFNDPQIAISLRIFGAAIPFAVVLDIGIGGIRGQMIPHLRVYIQDILQPVLRFGLIITAVFVAAGQAGFAAGYAAPYVITSVISIVALWRVLPSGTSLRDTNPPVKMIEYSLPFTVTGLASFVYNSIDIFLILYFLDSRAVGVYGVAYAFARLVSMFSTAFGYLSTPVSSQLESNNKIDKAINAQKTISRWILIATLTVAVPMAIFSSELLGLIYRPAYSTGGSVLIILILGFVCKNVLQVHKSILQALGKSKILAANTSTTAILNVVLNVILIPGYGIKGAAVATSVSFLILGLLPTFEVWYYTGSVSLSKEIFLSAAISVPLMILFIPVFNSTPETILWIMVVSSLFAIFYLTSLIFVVGFSRDDIMVIRSIRKEYDLPIGYLESISKRFQK